MSQIPESLKYEIKLLLKVTDDEKSYLSNFVGFVNEFELQYFPDILKSYECKSLPVLMRTIDDNITIIALDTQDLKTLYIINAFMTVETKTNLDKLETALMQLDKSRDYHKTILACMDYDAKNKAPFEERLNNLLKEIDKFREEVRTYRTGSFSDWEYTEHVRSYKKY